MPEFIYNKNWEGYAGVAESVNALDSKGKTKPFQKKRKKRKKKN